MTVTRLNHAVLYVRDASRTAAFYTDVMGFTTVMEMGGGQAVFLRAGGSTNDHDLGLFTIGESATASPAGKGAVGLYHLAWEVPTIDDLAAVSERLSGLGSLVGASDHGASKSLYARDLDGNEFEVMWAVPREAWSPEIETGAPTRPLDLRAELARWGQNVGSSHQG